MIAVHLENLLFLLLVAVAVLFQLLAKTAGKTGKDQTGRTSTPIPRTPPQIPSAPRESDEEQIRKFLEALGQPSSAKPPPPVVPRADIPARPLAPVQPPISPLSQLGQERLRKREVVAKEIPLPRTVSGAEKIAPPKMTSSPAFEVHEGPPPIEPQAIIKTPFAVYGSTAKDEESKVHIAILLASKSGLRDAIVLREILGPPRGLRALEFIGT
jgi:hypothetical protein